MATRSLIGVVLPNNSVQYVYCHWDGYPEHNGKILQENYNSQKLAELVTSLGDISSLQKHFSPTGEHFFGNPQKDVTVLYGRDRGDQDCSPTIVKSTEEYKNLFLSSWYEYGYLFMNDTWYTIDRNFYKNWTILKDIIKHKVES